MKEAKRLLQASWWEREGRKSQVLLWWAGPCSVKLINFNPTNNPSLLVVWPEAPQPWGLEALFLEVKVKVSLWSHGPWNSSGQNTRVGSHFLLQRIFPAQGLNPGLLHCRRILYQLSHLVGLTVNSKRVYAMRGLPRLLLPAPPALWWAPASPHLHRRPSNTTSGFGSVSCGVTAPLPWVLVCAKFCLSVPRLESVSRSPVKVL